MRGDNNTDIVIKTKGRNGKLPKDFSVCVFIRTVLRSQDKTRNGRRNPANIQNVLKVFVTLLCKSERTLIKFCDSAFILYSSKPMLSK